MYLCAILVAGKYVKYLVDWSKITFFFLSLPVLLVSCVSCDEPHPAGRSVSAAVKFFAGSQRQACSTTSPYFCEAIGGFAVCCNANYPICCPDPVTDGCCTNEFPTCCGNSYCCPEGTTCCGTSAVNAYCCARGFTCNSSGAGCVKVSTYYFDFFFFPPY